jgi:hypothetical protein
MRREGSNGLIPCCARVCGISLLAGEEFKDHHKLLKGNNDILNLTQPQIVSEIYRVGSGTVGGLTSTGGPRAHSNSQSQDVFRPIFLVNFSLTKFILAAMLVILWLEKVRLNISNGLRAP